MSKTVVDAVKSEIDDIIDSIESKLAEASEKANAFKSAPKRLAAQAGVAAATSAVSALRVVFNIPDDQSGDKD